AANKIGRAAIPALRISPASGIFFSTQHFDLGLVLKTQGLTVVGGQALVDGADVTAALAACSILRTRLLGGVTFRFPALTGGLPPRGVHTISVSVTFSDGSIAADTAQWEVDANHEP